MSRKGKGIGEYVSNPENRWMKTLNLILDNTNPEYGKKLLKQYSAELEAAEYPLP